jgi:hypothetical protein
MFLPKLPAEGNTAGSLGLGPEAAALGKSILKPSLLYCKQSGKHQDSHRNNKPVIKIKNAAAKCGSQDQDQLTRTSRNVLFEKDGDREESQLP